MVAGCGTASPCAQRLSATLMDAPYIELGGVVEGSCSTPFGDIDGCTALSPLTLYAFRVLNAFRRH